MVIHDSSCTVIIVCISICTIFWFLEDGFLGALV